MSDQIHVVGHRGPDTDAICSAIAYARLKRSLGDDAVAARAGEPNPETRYVLDRWGVDAPTLLDDAAGERLILVDHNEYGQAVDGAREGEIVEVVDHHRIGDVRTGDPIFFLNEPVGSTATVVTGLYDRAGVEVPPQIAGLLLGGLVSDTLLFRSPTTTERDREVAERLAETAGVDVEAYGRRLLEHKSKLGEKGPTEVVLGDFKAYEFGSAHVGIGQVETVDPETVLDRRRALLDAMDAISADRGYTDFLLLVTDVLDGDSTLLYRGDHPAVVETALDTSLTDHAAPLPGVVSRKKQVVPPLANVFD